MTESNPPPPKPAYAPWRASWTYQGRTSSTTFGSEKDAREYAAKMRKLGVRVSVRPV